MKRNFVKIIGVTVLTFMVISIVAFGVVCAQDKSELQNGGGRLEGTWDVRVSIINCQTGAEIRNFASLTTFMSGGITLDSTSGTPQALKTPGQGVWRHVGGNTYQFSFKSFSFDAANNFTGWTIIRHEAVLDSRGNEYTSAGTAEFYAANGNQVGAGCSSTTAVRFE
ncbi:MAG TPA: hypothetical protein VNB22_22445 [Pyrinomonadaceae bacterium]|nr:hypothetical protein [Pyrinomonadaceae bacterium]